MSPYPKRGDIIMGEIITKQCWVLIVKAEYGHDSCCELTHEQTKLELSQPRVSAFHAVKAKCA